MKSITSLVAAGRTAVTTDGTVKILDDFATKLPLTQYMLIALSYCFYSYFADPRQAGTKARGLIRATAPTSETSLSIRLTLDARAARFSSIRLLSPRL